MRAFADWLLALIKAIFTAVWDFITDVFVEILDMLLSGIVALIALIPMPQFMTDGLQNIINQIPGDVWFFAVHFKFPECMAALGAAVLFRLARKALTLFQW